jgi:hypothetical protein
MDPKRKRMLDEIGLDLNGKGKGNRKVDREKVE